MSPSTTTTPRPEDRLRQVFVPTVIEEGNRGDRAFDIYSQLLRERIVFLGQEVDDQVANLIISQMLFLEAQNSEGTSTCTSTPPVAWPTPAWRSTTSCSTWNRTCRPSASAWACRPPP